MAEDFTMDAQGNADPFASAVNPFAAGAAVVASNPFAQQNPFIAPARDAAPIAMGAGLGLEGPLEPRVGSSAESYAMLKRGADVNPDEVELGHLSAIEVLVLWETTVLHVSHLAPPRSFHVGDEAHGIDGCDYLLPSETLGAPRAPIVVSRGGAATLVMLPGSRGTVDAPGQGKRTFADLIASGRARPSAEVSGAHELDLAPGAKARMELEGTALAFQVSTVHAGKRARMAAPLDLSVLLYQGFSLLLHVGALAMFFFWYARLDAKDFRIDDDANASAMNPALSALAESEQAEEKPKQEPSNEQDKQGGTGERHKGEEGSMGNPAVSATNKRYAVKGPTDNKDPHLAKDRALEEAKTYGAIGLINTLNIGGDPNAPTSAFSNRDDTLGNDEVSARGNMFGKDIGDAFGNGGMGLAGTGEGGGGNGLGVGIGDFGGLGHGRGRGKGQGIGGGNGIGPGTHTPTGPKMGPAGNPTFVGTLPAAVIQRVVHANFGRFKQCYLSGLANNPTLSGRVAALFVIDRTGAVSLASNAGSDMPDRGVVGCVVGGFRGLTFPAPESGTVTVTYPIFFQPE